MSRNHQVLKQTFRLFSPRGVEGLSGRSTSPDDRELDEADVWSCLQPADARKPSVGRSVAQVAQRKKMEAASMPVNVPDWPKILLHEYKSTDNYSSSTGSYNKFDEEEEEGEVSRLPPHEMARRGRAASLSVVEGAGRTLKGRDLSRVRNAIWAQTGFQD